MRPSLGQHALLQAAACISHSAPAMQSTSGAYLLMPLVHAAARGTRSSLLMCSAPNSDGETGTAAAIGAPKAAALARFALPTLAAWLVSPLMSLVDTAVVGRDSVTALNLAALGPATMISDSMSYLFSFLSVATTNLVATALSDGAGADSVSGGGNSHELARIFGSAVRLAVLCGLISALLQATFGRALLARYTAARSAALVSPAYTYVRIRALGAPAALLVRVGTATCLAVKDPLSPLLAVAMGGALNLALDALLVSKLGIGGAAWATVASEAVCAVLVLRAVVFKLAPRAQLGSETTHVKQQRLRPMLRRPSRLPSLLPSRAFAATYATFAKPLVLTTAGKIATYSSLAHVATTVSVAGTAAHRVLMCVYWFMFPFAETWSQVAQTFLPGSKQTRALMRRLLSCGAAVGLLSAASSAGVLTLAPQLFTRSPEAASVIRSLTPLVAACIATIGPMCSMEGALLATRRLGFLSRFYTLAAVALVAVFQGLERFGLGLRAAWTCMLAFSVVRVGSFALALRSGNSLPVGLS